MRNEIRSHTGLRGIAALLVVAYHQQFTAEYRLPLETATLLFKRSYLMVDLFFILSGFVISYVYCADQRMDRNQVGHFFRARFARIYPLHVFALLSLTLFALAVYGLMAATGGERPQLGAFGDWLRQLLLLNAWFPAQTEWNTPSWSISAEAFAYLLFPLAAYAYTLSPRLMQVGALGLAVAFYLLVGASLDIVTVLAPLRCLAGFFLGMLLFYHRQIMRHVRWVSALQVVSVAWVVVVLAWPLPDPLIIPAFAALVLLTWQDRGIFARLLSTKPLHWLGEISYSVYLMHFLVGAVIWFVWSRMHLRFEPAVSRSMLLLLVFMGVLVTSRLTYKYVEKPCQNLLRRRSVTIGEAAVAAP